MFSNQNESKIDFEPKSAYLKTSTTYEKRFAMLTKDMRLDVIFYNFI